MRVFYFLIFCGFLFSCDKNKEFVQYTEYYHRDADTTYSYIIIPNSFTPNKDGMNDYYNIVTYGITSRKFEVTIYNNNEKVFYSNYEYYASPWDGTKNGEELPLGKYFYHLKATDLYGYVYDIKGQVNLLR